MSLTIEPSSHRYQQCIATICFKLLNSIFLQFKIMFNLVYALGFENLEEYIQGKLNITLHEGFNELTNN